jgi:large subunit ribosomal protein L25
METIKLSVEQRQEKGKGEMGRLRRSGRVPGIFYGPGQETVSVCVNTREFQYKVESLEGSHLIEFLSQTTDLNGRIALLKDVQHHPVTTEPLHIDFYEIDVQVPIQVGVPVHLVGKAEGVTAGGFLHHFRREIMVECLPLNIPESLEIDVTPLEINDVIRVEDVTLASGVSALEDAQLVLVSVVAPTVEAEPEEEADEAAAEDGAAAADGETPSGETPSE